MNARRCIRWLMILGFSSTPPAVLSQSDAMAPVGLHNVVFSEYSPLARSSDFLQRVLTPLAAQVIQRKLADSSKAMAEQSVDLSKEEFVIYVPPRAAAHGYALMVFVPPWQQAT